MSFAINESARRLREWRDRKQHVSVSGPVLERAHHDNEVRFLQRGTCSNGICAIEFGFCVQQEVRTTRIGEHRLRIETAVLGHRVCKIAADCIR